MKKNAASYLERYLDIYVNELFQAYTVCSIEEDRPYPVFFKNLFDSVAALYNFLVAEPGDTDLDPEEAIDLLKKSIVCQYEKALAKMSDEVRAFAEDIQQKEAKGILTQNPSSQVVKLAEKFNTLISKGDDLSLPYDKRKSFYLKAWLVFLDWQPLRHGANPTSIRSETELKKKAIISSKNADRLVMKKHSNFVAEKAIESLKMAGTSLMEITKLGDLSNRLNQDLLGMVIEEEKFVVPEQPINELRSFISHLGRYYSTGEEGELGKLEPHLDRSMLDSLKHQMLHLSKACDLLQEGSVNKQKMFTFEIRSAKDRAFHSRFKATISDHLHSKKEKTLGLFLNVIKDYLSVYELLHQQHLAKKP